MENRKLRPASDPEVLRLLRAALTGTRPLLSEGGAPGGVGAFGFVLDPAAIIAMFSGAILILLRLLGDWHAAQHNGNLFASRKLRIIQVWCEPSPSLEAKSSR